MINSLNELEDIFKKKNNGIRMPVVFIGHGSPMNAIADNHFTQTLNKLGKDLPTPEAILCISAHWMTEGTWITKMERPKTIHDFYGFPPALFEVQYPAPGRPDISDAIRLGINEQQIHADAEAWGLDHGTWSVLRHMYPEANIPVIQLSLYLSRAPEYHFQLGQQLARLRDKGILILGSGNIVHNLRTIKWEENAPAYEWATEFDQWSKEKIAARDFKAMQFEIFNTDAGKLSIPSMDHYYPLLYTLGAALPGDELRFEFEGIHNASISMRCLSFGRI